MPLKRILKKSSVKARLYSVPNLDDGDWCDQEKWTYFTQSAWEKTSKAFLQCFHHFFERGIDDLESLEMVWAKFPTQSDDPLIIKGLNLLCKFLLAYGPHHRCSGSICPWEALRWLIDGLWDIWGENPDSSTGVWSRHWSIATTRSHCRVWRQVHGIRSGVFITKVKEFQ